MQLTFWVWIITSAVLLIGEVLSPGYFMLPFGVGAASAAVMNAFGGTAEWQWISFVAVTSVVMVVLQRFVKKRRR